MYPQAAERAYHTAFKKKKSLNKSCRFLASKIFCLLKLKKEKDFQFRVNRLGRGKPAREKCMWSDKGELAHMPSDDDK